MRDPTDLKVLARDALDPIGKKLRGIYTSNGKGYLREISTSNLVQMVIQEATDPVNLVRQLDYFYTNPASNIRCHRGGCILVGHRIYDLFQPSAPSRKPKMRLIPCLLSVLNSCIGSPCFVQ